MIADVIIEKRAKDKAAADARKVAEDANAAADGARKVADDLGARLRDDLAAAGKAVLFIDPADKSYTVFQPDATSPAGYVSFPILSAADVPEPAPADVPAGVP